MTRMVAMAMEAKHLVLFPFPEHGHIIPMYQLALHLISRGAYVTFINTEAGHRRSHILLEHVSQVANLRYACISDGLPAQESSLTLDVIVSDPSGDGELASSAMPVLLRSLEGQRPALEKLLSDLNGAQHWPPLSCFITDAFMPWTATVACTLQISWMVFWTTSATRLNYTVEALDSKEIDTEQLKHATNIPGLPSIHTDALELLQLQNPRRLQLIKGRVEAMKKAQTILLNTFNALEEEAIRELALKLPILSLGPSCLGAGGEPEALKTDDECISWLDGQAPHSVLYIAFGSKVSLQGRALEQLALGVESSQVPFLWAMRSGGENLPEGFLERTKAKSMVMSWVPQKKVLEHRATGAFFTHCGWNSVVEGVVGGVPMICWPTFADQPTNKFLVEWKWRIGRGIDGPEVNAESIRQVIQDVMGNREFRQEASLLSASARSALEPGGTSDQNFNFLLSRG